ncbi:uncharacterized protein LOC110432335 isoform X2 [Sorghum bicolor]|uniref:Uncharacterized protein n=1 Tax=Sorghum bicolor TaxID=4558 RepID=A0A1B6Q8Q1_SORBI|nr:uncharacterized protein LOC110432335 isoform X2 [Sorghum bicolor]KXG34281.1 hypothetical protein SORBI_3002G013300 [Sorghum bicolor]|eukprot:XP_021308202.1 uncharacterized protein LOC110432335 isoform X2 [Sorghum bicolor]
MEADPPPPASALMEELVEEVLLRFPPADPASLVRAALVCRRWRRLVTGPRFHRRYRDLHLHRGRGGSSPPMLGFLADAGTGTLFVPTSTFRPAPASARAGTDGGGGGALLLGGWLALDARHGRALLRRDTGRDAPVDCQLAVWDPATGRRTDLPRLPWSPYYPYSWNAAVLCAAAATTAAAAACDHLDCSGGGGHFVVVVVGTNHAEMYAHVYSSETAAWSAPASARHPDDNVDFAPSALAGDALYFAFQTGTAALEFDLRTREMAVVRLPQPRFHWQRVVLASREDGRRLGLATAGKSAIYLWAREARSGSDGDWVHTRAVELDTLLPAGAISAFPDVVSFVEGVGVVIVRTGDGLFTIDLKSLQITKVFNDTAFSGIFPYMSFYTPALEVASTGQGPSSGA